MFRTFIGGLNAYWHQSFFHVTLKCALLHLTNSLVPELQHQAPIIPKPSLSYHLPTKSRKHVSLPTQLFWTWGVIALMMGAASTPKTSINF
jgi:hypothetical protein